MAHTSPRKWIKRASILGVGALATLAVVGASGFFTSGVSNASDSSSEQLRRPLDVEPGTPMQDLQPGQPLQDVLPSTEGLSLALPVPSDQYEYKNLGNGNCLTFDPDDGRDDGRRTAVTAPCDGTRNQMWTADFSRSDYLMRITNLGTGLCLEGERETQTVYIAPCTEGPEQVWQWTGTGFRNWDNLFLTQGRDKWPYLVSGDDAAENYGDHAWWQVNAR